MILIKIIHFINVGIDTIISLGGKKYSLSNMIPIQYEEYYWCGGITMELRNLKTFLVVADCGGFTRAGEQLGYTQSTVTNHVRTLEEAVGNRLFD